MLLTRSRLCPRPKPGSSLHLHVLGTPPAFVLSQDQTLREELLRRAAEGQPASQRVVKVRPPSGLPPSVVGGPGPVPGGIRPLRPHEGIRCTPRIPGRKTGFNLAPSSIAGPEGPVDATASNLDTHPRPRVGRRVRMLLSFQRPSHLFGKGIPSQGASENRLRSRSGPVSIAPAPPHGERTSTGSPEQANARGSANSTDPCPEAARYGRPASATAQVAQAGSGRRSQARTACRIRQDAATRARRARLRQDLDGHGPPARTVVEVDQHDLLPGAERRWPSTIGIVSEGPMTAARRWAWEFVSWLRRLCS